ncbi:hypothetical protein DBR17_06055 [Sphingomonas sp. HMWF008]|nr:hypothetical protein DBR17_06055 [Sphingomonas sp. HMWF008]
MVGHGNPLANPSPQRKLGSQGSARYAPNPNPVRAELVEALPYFSPTRRRQSFDKLRTNGQSGSTR